MKNGVWKPHKVRRSHDLLYAGELIRCGHCQRPITGERVFKKSKSEVREYVYYRCTGFLAEGHPPVRVRDTHIDYEVLALFDRPRVADAEVRDWFVAVLRAKTKGEQEESRVRADELQQQLSQVRQQGRSRSGDGLLRCLPGNNRHVPDFHAFRRGDKHRRVEVGELSHRRRRQVLAVLRPCLV